MSATADQDLLEDCGAILTGVHSVCLPDDLRLAARSHVDASATRLVQGLETLIDSKAVATGDGAVATDVAMSAMPRHLVPTLVHGDFCGENMVVAANGRVHVVDNETLLVHGAEYDLARTWYRWPMSQPQRAAFEAGYGDSLAVARFRAHFDFWATLVLVESALFRLRGGRGAPETPLRRLRSLLRDPRGSRRP